MTEDEPDTLALLVAANRLCSFCKQRLASYLHTRGAHPHETNTDTLRRINDLAGACCSFWKGREPGYWSGGQQ